MKAKTRIVLLLFGLILPYVVFALYFALRLSQHPLPKWFPYVAVCYFVGCIFLFPILKRKVLVGAPTPSAQEQKTHAVSAARALRRLGYIWLLGPIFYLVSGGPSEEPWWVTALGLGWAGFLSWVTFREAKKFELRARQNPVSGAGND